MSQAQATAEQLSPTNSDLQQATIKALEPRIKESDVRAFLEKAASAAPPIGATINWNIAVSGKLVVLPDDQPWRYDVTVWGGPASTGAGMGYMYTAEDSWDAFFQNTASYQMIVTGGIMLQINWFDSNGNPIGQCNAAGSGPSLQGGGPGKWRHTPGSTAP
jgi:hypothetical protein